MHIGVLYAMEKEAAGLLKALGGGEKRTVSGVPVYECAPGLVICVGGVGKVNAALAAQLLLDRFGVERIFNAGCAGALADLPTGTLVLGTECVQHDVDTTLAGDPPGFVSTVERVTFPCAEPLETLTLLANMGWACTPGVIATGDWFGRDFGRAAAIRRAYGALVCDMEACAAAQVCLRAGVPFQTLKVVSDHLFSDRQDAEYAGNLEDAMACLDGAVKTYLELMED